MTYVVGCLLDGRCRQVGRGDAITPQCQGEGLGADPARDVQDRPGVGPPVIAYDAGELLGLPLDAAVPVLEDQVVEGRDPVVEVGHRLHSGEVLIRAGSGSSPRIPYRP